MDCYLSDSVCSSRSSRHRRRLGDLSIFERARLDRLVRGNPTTRTFAELLIDCEEDRVLRAVLVGMLRESERP
jgi:hypothetical protein